MFACVVACHVMQPKPPSVCRQLQDCIYKDIAPSLDLLLQYFTASGNAQLLTTALTAAVDQLPVPDKAEWLSRMWQLVRKSFGVFNQLNADCLSVAFGYLNFTELMGANQACTKW